MLIGKQVKNTNIVKFKKFFDKKQQIVNQMHYQNEKIIVFKSKSETKEGLQKKR